MPDVFSPAREEDTTDYGPAATDALKSLAWRYWGDIWRSLYYYVPIRECAEEFRMQRRDDRQCTLGPVERKTITSLEGILVDEAFDAPFNTYAAAGLFALVSWRFLRAYPPLINRPATVLSSAFVPPGLFCLWRRSYMKRGMICQFVRLMIDQLDVSVLTQHCKASQKFLLRICACLSGALRIPLGCRTY
ncbi:hypothetical protein FOZ62_006459 [Perkinsus olseni]|uniref:Uncharacterized protein n=1 Tax=Perkinsus olseni TaxID=32597 RepID=A0A7J6S7A4_PEROL|nr:hypothetical protein FOZ62_006459 [Perkinsus olseni]